MVRGKDESGTSLLTLRLSQVELANQNMENSGVGRGGSKEKMQELRSIIWVSL